MGVLGEGRGIGEHVGGRVSQPLERDSGSAFVARLECHDSREVATGAVPHDGKSARVGIPLLAAGDGVEQRRVAVVDGPGPAVSRRESVRHRHDDDLSAQRHLAGEPVVPVEVASDPAAAVKEDHQRESLSTGGAVDAQVDRSVRCLSARVGHVDTLGQTTEEPVENGVVAQPLALPGDDLLVGQAHHGETADQGAEEAHTQREGCHENSFEEQKPTLTVRPPGNATDLQVISALRQRFEGIGRRRTTRQRVWPDSRVANPATRA